MLSAKHTAEKIVQDIFLSGIQWGQHDWKMAQEIITTAILEAENAKLEEAAEEAEGCRVPDGTALGEWAGGFIDGKNAAANSIRSLISKKEPVDLVGIGTAALERGLNSKSKD